MDKKKRERNVNFNWGETEKLVSLVESKKHIIENKKSDAVTWQEKENAWKAIETEFNSCGSGPFRDSKHLKLKYEALKRDTRKKASAVRAERYKTGGGPSTAPPLTPVEQKVKEMILLSVEGGASTFDSDHLDVAAIDENVVDPGSLVILGEQENLEKVDVGALDNENNVVLEIIDEPVAKKKCLMPETDVVASTSKQTEAVITENIKPKWAQWKPASLKSKKHPALSKPKEKHPFEKLAEAKLEIVQIQKKIIEEEMVEKGLQTQMLRLEMEHKKELYKLEKEQMLLKIEILKAELQKVQKK